MKPKLLIHEVLPNNYEYVVYLETPYLSIKLYQVDNDDMHDRGINGFAHKAVKSFVGKISRDLGINNIYIKRNRNKRFYKTNLENV